MTKYKNFRRCLATAPVKIISEADLVIFAIPPPANGPANDVDTLLWAIAVAMSRAPDPSSTRGSAPKVSQPSEILQVTSLRGHVSHDANASILDTAEHIFNTWNETNPSQMLQPLVFTSSGWMRFDTVSRIARNIFLRFDDATWAAYVPRSMVPSEQIQPQSSNLPKAPEYASQPPVPYGRSQSQPAYSHKGLEHTKSSSATSEQFAPQLELPSGVRWLVPEGTPFGYSKGAWGVYVEVDQSATGHGRR